MELDPQKSWSLPTRLAAKTLGVAVSTMKRWRAEGRGPTYKRSETGRIRYPTVELLAYRQEHVVAD